MFTLSFSFFSRVWKHLALQGPSSSRAEETQVLCVQPSPSAATPAGLCLRAVLGAWEPTGAQANMHMHICTLLHIHTCCSPCIHTSISNRKCYQPYLSPFPVLLSLLRVWVLEVFSSPSACDGLTLLCSCPPDPPPAKLTPEPLLPP